MKSFVFISLLLLFLVPAHATHIVGGELLMKHITESNYQITLNMYFDNINGNRGAIDPSILVTIFEKGTNLRKADIRLDNPQMSRVNYTAIACTSGSLSTDKIVYTRSIDLSPATYASPNGYYLVWERCCRNGVISNIFNPGGAGQAFYLEFPALLANGQRFVNSSPELFPPVSDYACLNELFYYNFGGKDPDGDSLVYELATPLNGHSTMNAPAPLSAPGPYSLVLWTAGLHVGNQIPGNPTLSIDAASGRLQVQPNRLGLFVFGVRCSEYRKKVKIGEVRRDFQLLVLNCPRNAAPRVQVKVAGQDKFYQPGEVLMLQPGDNPCLDLYLTDPDPNEALTVEAQPVNFTPVQPLLGLTSGVVNRNGVRDTLRTQACLPACLDTEGKTFAIDFIVSDDGCSLPKKDTIRVSFQRTPRPDQKPVISTTAASQVLKPRIGETIAFEVRGTDADLDVVQLTLRTANAGATAQGMQFSAVPGPGLATGTFTWTLGCQALEKPSHLLTFRASTTRCGKAVADSVTIEVQPQYANTGPTLATDLAGKTIDLIFGAAFSDSIFAADADSDLIHLTAAGDGFNLADYGMECLPASGRGKAATRFSWKPSCLIGDKEEFVVLFSVAEETCRPQDPAPLRVTFRVQFEASTTFLPANIFTPNNDGLNDFFEIPGLPPDLCQSLFSRITIYNRWGTRVYESAERTFKWDGSQVAAGVYYYVITYTDKKFKGTVTKVQ
ncbi:MAG: gliding motility-associated C-terminal domain-containing protein [Adhaeribacter sp.]